MERAAEKVDLHTHSTCSDGELTPRELVDYAADKGVAAVSITDHDTVEAYADTGLFDYAQVAGVELVPGIEVSTADDKHRYHILGLCINPYDGKLLRWLEMLHGYREQYLRDATRALEREGWQIDYGPLQEPRQLYTKAHVADAVVQHDGNQGRLSREFGQLPSRGQFIETYMNEGQKCFVPRHAPSPEEAVKVIHGAGGVALLAHPVAYEYEQHMTSEIIENTLSEKAFDGVEAMYYYYHKSGGDREVDRTHHYLSMAQRLGLIVSGGSDFHGTIPTIGRFIDMGYESKEVYPTLETLHRVQATSEKYKPN